MLVDVRAVAPSVDNLLAGAEDRRPFSNPDGRSSSAFEHVRIDGVPHVVEYVHLDDDFTMRASGDVACRTVRAWQAGLLDPAPDLIDHAIVGAATGWDRNNWWAALLMPDVSTDLLPLGNETIPTHQHAAFLDHLAGFCAATWGWPDDRVSGPALLPYAARWAGSATTPSKGIGLWVVRSPCPDWRWTGSAGSARWRRLTSPASSRSCGVR